MANLMTPAEVIAAAFDRAVEESKIPENVIAAAQVKHVKQILGEEFYEAVVADLVTYSALVTQIKPMLAYFVKFWTLPKIHVETGTVGMARIQGQNRQPANQNDSEKLREDALQMARMHGEILRRYLEVNESSYPLYFRGNNPKEQITIAGGIVIDNRLKIWDDFYCDDDDYTMYLKNY